MGDSARSSHFTQNVVCTRITARGRDTLSGGTLIEVEGDVRRETPVDGDARPAVLARCFGIVLPAAEFVLAGQTARAK